MAVENQKPNVGNEITMTLFGMRLRTVSAANGFVWTEYIRINRTKNHDSGKIWKIENMHQICQKNLFKQEYNICSKLGRNRVLSNSVMVEWYIHIYIKYPVCLYDFICHELFNIFTCEVKYGRTYCKCLGFMRVSINLLWNPNHHNAKINKLKMINEMWGEF